ncbi:AraC family transcriptional regulator [Bacteroides sp. 51]|uniref:helix-turn-helix domain-containing protein n=1 Tax=Bacteroides sp. 51 TaxID=2302938 RepID=UPI0013D0E9BD|nr:AraC family transcriptional regulator [Bacteroides sp. 51]NDV80572.1 AraC family transcriptional regulator [Bacteroides sp. 51]
MLKSLAIFTPFFVSLFWTIMFLINRKQNSRSQNIWGVATALCTISMGIMAFYWHLNGNYSLYYKLDIVDYFITLSFIPAVFLYFRELTGDKSRVAWKIILLMLPPILFGSLVGTIYLLLGDEEASAFVQSMIENQGEAPYDASMPFYEIHKIANGYGYSLSFFLQAVCVIIYAGRRLLVYRRQLADFFSNIEDKSLDRHWGVLWGMMALLVLATIVSASGYLLYISYTPWVPVITVTVGVIQFYTCYHAYHSYYTAEDFVRELTTNNIITEFNDNSEDPPTIHANLLTKFNHAIDVDKLFLQKNLRVDDITSLIGTNRTYISRILREEYECNFWTFINIKRIEYAKEQALLDPTLSVEHLAEMCGFSHNTAFSRAFRQCEGITFSEWQNCTT